MSDKQTTLLGGRDLGITLRNGKTETVKVRQIPVWEMQKYAAAIQNELAMAEIFTARPAEWCKSLSDQSFEEIIMVGREINAHFFGRWMERQRSLAESIAPGITEKVTSQITLPSSPSNAGSPSDKP